MIQSVKVAANGNRSQYLYFFRFIFTIRYRKIYFYQKSNMCEWGVPWGCTNNKTHPAYTVCEFVTIAYLICHILISANTISSSHLKSIQFNAVLFLCKKQPAALQWSRTKFFNDTQVKIAQCDRRQKERESEMCAYSCECMLYLSPYESFTLSNYLFHVRSIFVRTEIHV